jgi:hypothetical protein
MCQGGSSEIPETPANMMVDLGVSATEAARITTVAPVDAIAFTGGSQTGSKAIGYEQKGRSPNIQQRIRPAAGGGLPEQFEPIRR